MTLKRIHLALGLRALLASAAVGALGCAADPSQHEPGAAVFEGELEVFAIDYEDGLGGTAYTLRTAEDETLSLSFPSDPDLASGKRLRVRGQRSGDDVIVDSFEEATQDIQEQTQALTGNSVRTQTKLAVIMVHWGTPDAQTPDGLRSKLFTSATSTAAFYDENSYDLFSMQGDVFGWFQVPAMTNCDFRTLATNARTAAQSGGVDLSSYRQILYYFPRSTQCNWSGLAMVGTPTTPARDSWYNGSSGCSVLAHELLHNFGAQHSRSYTCTVNGARVAIGDPASCTYSEYGDPYDPMGSGCYHFHAYQKAAQGWFGKCNAVTASADGEFDVVPTALASNDIQTLRVPMNASYCPAGTTGCFYYIEYRQPVGLFDSLSPNAQVHQGVTVRVAPAVDFSGRSRPASPYLLDLTPTSSSGHRDPALTVGQTFTDPAGIGITLVSRTATSARVRLSFPGGGSGAPTCSDGTTLGAVPPPPPPPGTCPTGQSAYEGHCYMLTGSAKNYDNAAADCRALGTGYGAARIDSASENQFVSTLIGAREAWLGGTDRATEGEFIWDGTSAKFWTGGATGGPVAPAYQNFLSGEPNGGGTSDCVRMVAGGSWRDIQCSGLYRVVCESGG
ncbi:MAG TPA: lectin-like protein [Polyangiales bacterium]